MILTYRLIHGKEGINYRKFFTLAERSHNTRGHSLKITKPTIRLETRRFFFSNRVIDKWNNDLTEEEVTASSTHMFKKMYDEKEKICRERIRNNIYQM